MKQAMHSACLLISLWAVSISLSAQVIVTHHDSLIYDSNNNLLANPGDSLRYKTTVKNINVGTVSGAAYNVNNSVNLGLPTNVRTSPVAVDDAYAVTGNVGIMVLAGSGLKVNDFDDNLVLATITPLVAQPMSMGAMVTVNSDGSFTYTPPAGYTGSDSFAYTLEDGNELKGQVTLALRDNQIRRYNGNAGIFADNTGGNYNVDLTITGNLTAEPGPGAFAGLALAAGAPLSADDIDICALIGGAGALRNDFSAGDPANANDMILGISTGASSIRLPGYAGASLADVQTFVFNNNNFAGTVVTAYVDPPATAANFIGGAVCNLP
jgi:uncharacterized protein YdeI (BOF family)